MTEKFREEREINFLEELKLFAEKARQEGSCEVHMFGTILDRDFLARAFQREEANHDPRLAVLNQYLEEEGYHDLTSERKIFLDGKDYHWDFSRYFFQQVGSNA